MNLNRVGKDIVIVPVMINYDRIYEQGNLSIEMVSGKKKDYTFYSALQRILTQPKDSLGQVYVKYLDPIDLKTYLTYEVQSQMSIGTQQFEQTAVDLTGELNRRQVEATPVTLNQLLSAWVLMEKAEEIKTLDLISNITVIYDYLTE